MHARAAGHNAAGASSILRIGALGTPIKKGFTTRKGPKTLFSRRTLFAVAIVLAMSIGAMAQSQTPPQTGHPDNEMLRGTHTMRGTPKPDAMSNTVSPAAPIAPRKHFQDATRAPEGLRGPAIGFKLRTARYSRRDRATSGDNR